jgi:hypothetical protein
MGFFLALHSFSEGEIALRSFSEEAIVHYSFSEGDYGPWFSTTIKLWRRRMEHPDYFGTLVLDNFTELLTKRQIGPLFSKNTNLKAHSLNTKRRHDV